MYIITASYKGTNDMKYNLKIEKLVGRCADSWYTNGHGTTLRWERKSSKSVDRILTILNKLRKITAHYCKDSR